MIDLHTHILHEFDDGARTLADAVAIARIAVANGISVMAATPHGHRSVSISSRYSVALLHERLAELRAALADAALPLELVAGTEIYGEPGALERLHTGALLPYGTSRAILLEFPLMLSAEAAAQLVFAFQLEGYRVVIAHPERYRFVQRNPNALIPLIERGALTQLTADALLGAQGTRMRHLAELLLRHRLVHILATDSHGPHLGRMPHLAEAREQVASLMGAEIATELTTTIPAAVLADAPLNLPTPTLVRRWFERW